MARVGADYQPRGRYGHTSHIIEGNLYMWGGLEEDLPLVHDSEEKKRFLSCIEVLDLSRGKWWQEPTIGQPPLAVDDYSSAVIGNDIYYYGGYCPHGVGDGCDHNSLYRLNVVSKVWSEVSPTTTDNGPMKKRECGMAAIRINNQDLLIVIGGRGPTNNNTPHQHNALYEESYGGHYVFTNEIHYYDLSSDKWISIKSTGQCPPPCCDFTITSVNDNTIILFGGVTSNGRTNDIFIGTCSSSTIKWEKIPFNVRSVKWPEGRCGHATTLLDEHHLLVVGGYPTSDSWIFDITRRTWEELTLPQSVTDRYDHSLSVMSINSSIAWVIVFGGIGLLSDYLSDTSVIELRRSDGGEWSVEGIMTLPLEDYEEKLKKINPYIISFGKQQQQLQHLRMEKQQMEERLHEQERILQEENDHLRQEKDQLQHENDQLQHEKDYLLHHQQLIFQEQLSAVIPPTSTVTQSQSSSSGAQPISVSSGTQLSQPMKEQLIQVINGVLQSHYADLTGLPEESLQALADKLFASNLISDPVRKNPAMDKFISEFKASLKWIKSQSAIQSQCGKLLKAFTAVGGSYSMAANVLHEELIKAVNDKLNCDFCIKLDSL